MDIVTVEKAEPWVLEGLNALLPQLTDTRSQLSIHDLEKIVASDCTALLAAVDGGRVVGSLTLAVFTIPTGVRARIEDVVVDASVRGKGIGALLTRQAIALAKMRGADAVDLTSNPSRIAANRLYRKMGFVLRKTNTYRYDIPGR